MTNRRYGYIRDRQYLQNPDQEPSLDELVREYMGAAPPVPPPPATPALPTRPGDQVVSPVPSPPQPVGKP
jgi:general secretion pathway protein D